MQLNVGSLDRIIRFVVAAVLVAAIALGWLSGVLAIIAGVLAAVFVVTATVKFCPLYLPFKLSTKK